MSANSQVADLILQLMMRGKAGGLPMQASPELVQYLAHARGGTAPPQLRELPSADVLQGPGSGHAAINDPNFLAEMENGALRDQITTSEYVGDPKRQFDELQPDERPMAMDMLTDRPPVGAFNTGSNPANTLFIWYTNPKTGKRIALDGPFTDDLSARRAFNELRQSGLTDPLEISPY